MLTLCPEILDKIVVHAIEKYPEEACGILIGEKGQGSATEFIPCKNLYDEMHRREPNAYPRTARTAFLIDSREQRRIFDEAEGNHQEVKAIVHSHTDHDAYFSEEDRLIAAPWGDPMFPGISYIVISIWNRKFKEANEFFWDEEKKDFACRGLLY